MENEYNKRYEKMNNMENRTQNKSIFELRRERKKSKK